MQSPSDRYIPCDVSRNLFNIQPFEVESQHSYSELLSENMLQNNQASVLSFHKQKQETPQKSLFKPEEKKRKIDTQPYKVLDAPDLEDDFYQDTLHWGKNNLIAVGLKHSVYLYNVDNQKVFCLAEAQTSEENYSYYTSIQWNQSGSLLAVGCYDGSLLFWDYAKQAFAERAQISSRRISSISWANNHVFAYGCKDHSVIIGDVRVPNLLVACLKGHTQEVCGVAFDGSEF